MWLLPAPWWFIGALLVCIAVIYNGRFILSGSLTWVYRARVYALILVVHIVLYIFSPYYKLSKIPNVFYNYGIYYPWPGTAPLWWESVTSLMSAHFLVVFQVF